MRNAPPLNLLHLGTHSQRDSDGKVPDASFSVTKARDSFTSKDFVAPKFSSRAIHHFHASVGLINAAEASRACGHHSDAHRTLQVLNLNHGYCSNN